MKVLVVGGGGREHAIVWRIVQNPKVETVYCAPGNAGMAELAHCISIKPTDIQALLDFAQDNQVDMTVIGPEAPLVEGIVDIFEEHGLPVFGPNRAAAQIEGSKVFAKNFMHQFNIPTAPFKVFDSYDEACTYIQQECEECVVKADGLCGGKGVMVCGSRDEALQAVERIMVDRIFGDAGDRVVVENKLSGEEVSILAFTDGKTILPMVSSQDHKAVYDGDRGPNTGGMGAYSPAPVYTEAVHEKVIQDILEPSIKGLSEKGIKYKGVLYAGLMLTENGPQVLEFNVRFGDPETQPILLRLESGLIEVFQAVIKEKLEDVKVTWNEEPSVCVVAASGGYPGKYEKEKPISGLEKISENGVVIFHAGTETRNGEIVTSGGRVLGVTSRDSTLQKAIAKAYRNLEKLYFENIYYRKDIGQKAL